MTDKFVVACDGSPSSVRALHFAVEEAGHHGASLVLAHVLDWQPYSFLTIEELEERHKRRTEEMGRARDAVLEPLVRSLADTGLEIEVVVRYGSVVESLVDIVKHKRATQIFVGRTGQSEVTIRLFGSVASSMVQVSPVPCTVVP